VRAQPIEGGDFIERLDGYVSAGLDFAKASDRRSLDFAGGLSSRTRIREWSLDGSANITDDSAGKQASGISSAARGGSSVSKRDFYLGFGGLERNTELDLNLRTLVGAGYGRYFVQTNSADWLGGLGLAYSHENYSGGATFDSLEAVFSTSFAIFSLRFSRDGHRRCALGASEPDAVGRYRAEADLRAKYEFVDDLYFEIKVYGSYDSKHRARTPRRATTAW